MKKIEKLTEEQKSQFKPWVKKWVEIGMSTEPADFDLATDAALKAYALCNLKKPMVILRVESPYAATVGGAIAWNILKKFSKAQVGDQVRDQVWDQVGAQVGAQVRDQVGDQVWDQVGDQVWAQVWDQVGDQVGAQVLDQVRDQVGDQVGDQVWDQVGAQVWDQVGAQVRDQVGAQVLDQVRDQVGDQVGAQVWDQVGAQVLDQVRDQVRDQAKEGFYNYGISNILSTFTAFVTFFRDVCGWGDVEILNKLEINENLVKSVGWTWWHENVLVLSDRPKHIYRDELGRLHHPTQQAIEYRDGWGFYCWHGVRIPAEWITSPESLTSEIALKWGNIEQRRAACEILGWSKIIGSLSGKVIDADNDPEVGTLIECDIPDSGKERFLKVKCGTGRDFVIPIPPHCMTALEANLWTYGIDNVNRIYMPEVRT